MRRRRAEGEGSVHLQCLFSRSENKIKIKVECKKTKKKSLFSSVIFNNFQILLASVNRFPFKYIEWQKPKWVIHCIIIPLPVNSVDLFLDVELILTLKSYQWILGLNLFLILTWKCRYGNTLYTKVMQTNWQKHCWVILCIFLEGSSLTYLQPLTFAQLYVKTLQT